MYTCYNTIYIIPIGRPELTDRHIDTTLANNTLNVRTSEKLIPFKNAIISGIPDPAAPGCHTHSKAAPNANITE